MGANVPDVRGLFLRGYGSQTHAQNNGSTVGITSTTHSSGALGKYRAMPCALSQVEGFTILAPMVEVPLRHGDTQISGE